MKLIEKFIFFFFHLFTMQFMKSVVQSIVDGKITSIENAIEQAAHLAESIQNDEVDPLQQSNELKESNCCCNFFFKSFNHKYLLYIKYIQWNQICY